MRNFAIQRVSTLASLIVCVALSVSAQTPNTINTIAGGGTNPTSPTAAFLGGPTGVVKDGSGNVYIVSTALNEVFEVSAGGQFSVYAGTGVKGFSGDGGQANQAELDTPNGIALDGTGNLYIADYYNQRIRRVDATTGIITTYAGSSDQRNGPGFFGGYSGDNGAATSALLNGPSAITFDSNGNLFIADSGNDVVRVVDNSSQHVITTYAGNGTTGTAGTTNGDGGPATSAELALTSAPGSGNILATDTGGNLYIADTNDYVVRIVNPSTHDITTYAGSPSHLGYSGDGGPATSAGLDPPTGVVVDGNGNLFITFGVTGFRVREVAVASPHVISSVAGAGGQCVTYTTGCGDGGPATAALLDQPLSIFIDSSENLLIADYGSDRVRVVDLASQNPSPVISIFAGGGSDGTGGPATSAILAQPYYLASDASGDLFVPEIGAFSLNRIDGSTGVITPYAGNGLQGSTGNGGPATQANTNFGYGVALDGSGNLFFTGGLPYVRRVDAVTKTITAFAGSIAGFCVPSGLPSCGDGGPATSATFEVITGLAADPQGNVYVSDYVLNRIRRIDATTGIVTNYAGTGAVGYSGDGGPATSAQFSRPFGLAFDSQGNLYVADSGNNVIRKVDNTAAHNITTYAFNGLPTFGGDGGAALSASMESPISVAVDPNGNLFVVGGGAVVRRIDNGEGNSELSVITVAGDVNNLDGGFSGDGGPSTQAMLLANGIGVDAHHNLYIADGGNNRIRKVPLAPVAVVTPVLPSQFGPVFAGSSSSAIGEVLFGNTGLDDLLVTNVAATAGFVVSTCNGAINSFAVPPGFGEGCAITVTFSPAAGTAPGTVAGTLTFNTNDPANPSFSISLTGVVAASPGVMLTVTGVGSGIIESSPSGIDCEGTVGTCSENVPLNEQVTLEAVPLSGFSFAGWTVNGSSSTCPGTTACTITVSAATNVVATFNTGSTSPPLTLTVAGGGNGSGTITSSPAGINCTIVSGVASGTCSFSGFPAGTTTVVLTATATANSKFAGWLTTLCGLLPLSESSGPCRFTLAYAGVISAPQVTAVFSGPPQAFVAGQIFVGSYAGTILVYNPNGTLAQVLSSGNLSVNSPIYGMNFDKTGNLYASSPGASGVTDGTVEFFANDGSGPTTFGTYTTGQPSDVLLDPSGDVFTGNASGTQLTISEFAAGENGAPTSLFYPADDSNGGNGQYIDLLNDNESMLYTTGGSFVGNFDISYNHQNPDFADNLPGTGAYQIRELNDGSVLVAVTTEVVRLSPAGSVIQTYTPGGSGKFYALALDPSGSSFWTGDGVTGNVYQIRVSDGTVLNTVNTGLTFASSGSPVIFGIAVLGATQTGGADVSVGITGPTSSVLQNSQVTYTITVKNNGPSSAANVAVTDAFPSGITVVSTTTSVGSCATEMTVTCTLGTMTSGQTVTVTLVVTSSLAGTVFQTVNATTTTPDPNPANNEAAISTTVLAAATLQIEAPFTGSGTVTDNLGRINCVDNGGTLSGTCIANYATGTEVTLTGTPSAGSVLSGWYPCTGTGTCTVQIGSSNQIAEVFFTPGAPVTFTLSVSELGTGTGTVTDNTGQISCSETNGVSSGACSGSYASGTSVTLTASATSPATFGGWGGACSSSGTTTTCGLTITANTNVTANFVPPPASVNLTFAPGTNVAQQATYDCPSGTHPCTDPNAHALNLQLPQVNGAFTVTVTATEIPPSQADGLCEVGNTVANDFDCRFVTFFSAGTDPNGNTIVPLCYPYANGNCVHYQVYSGTPGTEPDPSLYTGPVSWVIEFNNDTFVPPGPYWTGSTPQFYDDPDYAPTPTSAVGSVCTQPMTINGVAQSYFCQFEFDITTFINPTQPVDTAIGALTKQLNDVAIAFPPNTVGQLTVTSTPSSPTTSAGQPISFTVNVSNSGSATETNVDLNDPLPAGSGVNWAITPAFGGPGTCAITGPVGNQTLNCTFGTLEVGANTSVTVVSATAGAGTYQNAATITSGTAPNVQQYLTIASVTVQAVSAAFSGLTPSQSIQVGTASISLTGAISGAGPIYPASGESVSVTINGVTQPATIGQNGVFSLSFSTANIPASATPYTITYSYAGDANLTAATDLTTTLTVNQVVGVPFTLTVSELGTGTGTVSDNTGQINCSEANGVSTGTCSASYASGTSVTLTASATSPATFGGWGGACSSSGTGTTCGLTITATTNVTANFVPPPASVNLTFNPGANVAQQATYDCPSGTHPCTDPNAHALQLQLPQVNSAFTITVTATEIPPSQADGLCEVGNNVNNDFDCRFVTFFSAGKDPNGNTIVPLCYPYANGNCVHYQVYSGTPGTEPDPSLYTGPVSWEIAFNNDTFVPPGPYWTGSIPQFYDDPDYAPTPTSAVGSVCTQPMTINGVAQNYFCQFEFDITTFINPTQPVDTVIGALTRQLNDVTIAFPPNTVGQLTVTSTPDAAVVPAGQPIGFTVAVNNGGSTTAKSVLVSDPLPPGVKWTFTQTGAAGKCGITGSGTLLCVFGNLAPGAGGSLHVTAASAPTGTYVNAATVTINGQQFLTITSITVGDPATSFSGLTPSQSIAFGTPSINLSGTISAAGPTYPPSSETISATINGTTQTATIGANGTFSLAFPTAALPASTTPYVIKYAYAGDATFGSTTDSSTTVTVQKASTNATIISNAPNPSNTGQAVSIGVQVTGNGVPTGTVQVTASTSETCTATLASATGSCSITFTTAGSRTLTAAYSGDSNFSGSTSSSASQTVNTLISGTLKTSAGSIDFGSVYVGNVLKKVVTLTNPGTTSVAVGGISIAAVTGGDSNDFTQQSACVGSLAANKSCKITITFSPDASLPTAKTATLVITDTAAGSPQSVSLTGTMTNPRASLTTNGLAFSGEKTKSTTAAKPITLTNSGTTPLIISTISLNGNFAFTSATTCTNGQTIQPSASCTFAITFTPQSKGLNKGSVTISDNALHSPQTISLSGTGN